MPTVRGSQSKRAGSRGVPLETHLRWRGKVRVLVAVLALLLVLALVWLDRRGWFLYRGDDLQRFDGQAFLVTRVIDGDTFELAAPDGGKPTTRVRFWGINAPELDHDGPPIEHQPWGPEAKHFTRSAAEGKRVKLTLEPARVRDNFGRLLAFVELPDGHVLNEELLARGLARADGRWTHRWLQRYTLLEQQAKHDKVGMWGETKAEEAQTSKKGEP
jgi:endonuclease YncB( thermonuclease family)